MKVPAYSSLNEMMRKAPLTQETVSEFRDRALQAVDHAVDIFFQPDREVADGKKAYDQLSDVERALRSYQGRFERESQQVNQELQAKMGAIAVKDFRGSVGKTDSLLPDGKPLEVGFREVNSSYPRMSQEMRDIRPEQGRVGALIAKMSEVLPLYGSVAMVPGPLAVSLKDHLKESLQWKNEGSSAQFSSAEEEAYRLLTLSAAKKEVRSSASSSSREEGRMETSTIDERVMPGLHEIRTSLLGLAQAPEESVQFSQSSYVKEYETKQVQEGMLWWKEDVTRYTEVNQGNLTQSGSGLARPARLHLDGEFGNEGLTRSGAGSDLVEMVAKAELNEDFVDQFRGRSLEVLDSAVATLFNTGREVSQGRQNYDELANLQRALEMASSKFGRQNSYYQPNHLHEPIQVLADVAPLYACVAMVPGEMSSSVKNYAKELFEIRSSAQSVSSSRSTESSVSLFGSIKEGTSVSGSSSKSQGHFKAETVTTDERIMPALHQLRVQLDQMQVVQDRYGNYLDVPSMKPKKEERY
jgi:hypothetical protein